MDYGEKQHFEEDPRDNLNLENWAPEHDSKDIGNMVLASNENAKLEEKPLEEDFIKADNDMPKIENISIPASRTENPANVERLELIVGNRFGNNVETEIKRAEDELGQTGNISNFYDEMREMSKIATEKWVA